MNRHSLTARKPEHSGKRSTNHKSLETSAHVEMCNFIIFLFAIPLGNESIQNKKIG